MAPTALPRLDDVGDARAWRISEGDTAVLVPLRRPAHHDDTSICLEIWDPGGAQPPNSHPRSTETFVILDGSGIAVCDDVELDVRAGQVLTLPAGSQHHLHDAGDGRLRALTWMAPDDGFVDLIESGRPETLGAADLAALTGRPVSVDRRDPGGPVAASAIIASVASAVVAYDAALEDGRADDAAAAFDLGSSAVVSRFGPEGAAWSGAEVLGVRRAALPAGPAEVLRSEIDPLADDVALVRSEMTRAGRTVLRTQLWRHLGVGWRIAHAHVSSPPAV